jgi:hypothetical protein
MLQLLELHGKAVATVCFQFYLLLHLHAACTLRAKQAQSHPHNTSACCCHHMNVYYFSGHCFRTHDTKTVSCAVVHGKKHLLLMHEDLRTSQPKPTPVTKQQ